MNEKITAGGVAYAAQNVTTGTGTISFMPDGLTADEAFDAFRNEKSLTVGSDGEDYGAYPDVEFESVTRRADGSVTVAMHILSGTEKQIRDLQATQAEQDEAIAQILYGGGAANE